jgi:hypothetical protein
MGVARNYVSVPAPDVAQGGVLRAARVIDSTDPHDMLGAEYVTDACAEINVWEEYCTLNPASPKVFDDDPGLVVGDPFTLYAGVSCNLQRLDEGLTRARNRLDFGERAGVDLAVTAAIAALPPVDLGGPFSIGEAIGLAENYAGLVYGGVPTILIPRPVVVCGCLNGAISTGLDGSLTTCQGSRVANYVVSQPPPATLVLYVTGQITLLRSAVMALSTPQQPLGDGTYEPPRALAERTYVPLIECLAAQVEVTCT